jgi:hypothetical protein
MLLYHRAFLDACCRLLRLSVTHCRSEGLLQYMNRTYESYMLKVDDDEDRRRDQDQSEIVQQELTLFEIGNSLSKITATVTIK